MAEIITRQDFAIIESDPIPDGDGYRIIIAANSSIEGVEPIDLDQLDVSQYLKNPVILWEHGYRGDGIPIAQTLSLESDPRGLIANFKFDTGNAFARKVKGAYDRGFIRAASARARFVSAEDYMSGKNGKLVEWSLVAIPIDDDALRTVARSMFSAMLSDDSGQAQDDDNPDNGRDPMPPEDAPNGGNGNGNADPPESQRSGNNDGGAGGGNGGGGPQNNPPDTRRSEGQATIDLSALESMMERVADKAVSNAFEARDKAEAERSAAAKKAEEDKAAAEKARSQSTTDSNRRAELIYTVRSAGLIAQDVDTTEMTDRDIILQAVGDTVDKAEDQSTDYLRAVVDNLATERSKATANLPIADRPGWKPSDNKGGGEDPRHEALRSQVTAQDEIYSKSGGV